MFERYTEKARRVIFFARFEASQHGEAFIEPHHLLLALIREDKLLVARFCKSKLPLVDHLRDQILATIGSGDRNSTTVDLPLSTPAKRVLAYAAEESERLSQKHIGTEHMLLGLLRAGEKPTAKIFREYGVDLDEVRNTLRDEISAKKRVIADIGKAAMVEEMRDLAAEARNLAAELIKKAERIDAICDQLNDRSSREEEQS
jgi:ATP-dependent Clp protease ATP-binding subunit ClpC